jgi:hypothetical protein
MTSRRRIFSIGWIMLCTMAVSCISYTAFQTADVSEPGKGSLGLGVGAYVLKNVDTTGYYNTEAVGTILPVWPSLSFRFAFIRNLEVGIRYMFPLDGTFDVKYQLVKNPIIVSPVVGIGGMWAGWGGVSGGHDTTYTPSTLIKRYDIYGKLMIGREVNKIQLFIAPLVMRSSYAVRSITYLTYGGERIGEDVHCDEKNVLYQYGIGFGVWIKGFFGEFDYVHSEEFDSYQLGIGIVGKQGVADVED